MSKCKNIVLTGGNRGIGLELVKQMLTRLKPDNLFVTYRDPASSKELLELASKCGNVHAVMLDVRDTKKYDEFVAKVDAITIGAGINLLINNSGILKTSSPLSSLSKEGLMEHFEVNTVAPIVLSKAFLPLLEKASGEAEKAGVALGISRAAIVNISSVLGSIELNSGPDLFGYGYKTSKCALNQASKNMSIELLLKGILVIPLHPGWVKTDMGGQDADLDTSQSASGILNVLEKLDEKTTGHFMSFDGKELPW